MLCKNPYPRGKHVFACGQCFPCRFNRRRVWSHRMMLEASLWETNAFISLTYADEFIPLMMPGDGTSYELVTPSDDGSSVSGSGLVQTLVPRHLTLWLKRLRKEVQPSIVRFYAVGEYGDVTLRPHYHVALFNFPMCVRGGTNHFVRGSCCAVCELVSRTWGMGRISVDVLNVKSAQYIAGYVTKKLTDPKDEKLEGRFPEFARMSNRPGIGAYFMDEVASELLADDLSQMVDVPMALRHGGRSLPLGAYLRRRLRRLVGRDEKTPQVVLDAMAEEVRPMWEASGDDEKGHKEVKFKEEVIRFQAQRIRNMEGRAKIFNRRKDRL